VPRDYARDKLNRELSTPPSAAPGTPNIAHRKRGAPLPRSVQSQRSLFLHSAQGAQSKDRREWITEAGEPLQDFRGGPGSMIVFLPSQPVLDRRGDNYLMQCSFSFSFRSLNAHCAVVGCRVFWKRRSTATPRVSATLMNAPNAFGAKSRHQIHYLFWDMRDVSILPPDMP